MPGSGGQSGTGQSGGLAAGTGSAPLGNTPTNLLDATRRGVVQAQVGQDGASQVRSVEPKQHQEEAQREARKTAVEFIKVQEEALADEPLPAARREHVRRYFNSLRQQLTSGESPHENTNEPANAQP
jgi:hypothetical protein